MSHQTPVPPRRARQAGREQTLALLTQRAQQAVSFVATWPPDDMRRIMGMLLSVLWTLFRARPRQTLTGGGEPASPAASMLHTPQPHGWPI